MRTIPWVLAVLLSGCAHVDVGQVDYKLYSHTDPQNLQNKFISTGLSVTIDDYYSIEIVQAMVGPDISEGRILGRNTGKHAELAILANVFELDDTRGEGFVEVSEYTTKALEGKPGLKLVYYGDNLERLQPFNFSNMPVIGRKQYKGGRVGVQIVIQEIDGENPAIASLLETLAGYGKSVSPVPQVTDVLLDLGTSMMRGSKDDRIFDYRFTLSSGAAVLPNGALNSPGAFVPGPYILMKSKQRQTQMDWSGLRYDQTSGRLMKKDRMGKEIEFRDALYLVLNVTTYPDNFGAEAYDPPEWVDFRASLAKSSADRSIPLATLENDFKVMIAADRSGRLKVKVLGHWGIVDQAIGHYIANSLGQLDSVALSGCTKFKDQLLLERDLMKRQMSDGVRVFLASYKAAIAQPSDSAGNKLDPELKQADEEALISVIARTYMPWADEADSANFVDAATFKAAYFESNGAIALSEALVAVANRKSPSPICPKIN